MDYRDFYHFLEGVGDYSHWGSKIDWRSKNLQLKPARNVWNDLKGVEKAFADLLDKFKQSVIVVSYRSDGIPSVTELRTLLSRFKKHVLLRVYREYKYVLSNSRTDEILLVGY